MAGALPPQLEMDSLENLHPLKRRRRGVVPPPPEYEDATPVVSEEVTTNLLNRSAAMILKSVGYNGATTVAQERLRQLAEDHYLRMLRVITLFATSQRRTKPTVVDFEDMLQHMGITLSSLESEMLRMPSKTHTFVLPPSTPPPSPTPDLATLLGPELADTDLQKRSALEDFFPPLPSKHTYKATPLFTERPTEPRVIRERATEEARLAENALRKLLAVSAHAKNNARIKGDVAVSKKRKDRDEAWREAFDESGNEHGGSGDAGTKVNGTGAIKIKTEPTDHVDVLAAVSGHPVAGVGAGSTGGGGEGVGGDKDGDAAYLEVIVNAESRYWRKSRANIRRRQATDEAVAT
ncbi:transcription factor TFIID complex subunit 8 C-term-domain-containing protein [Tuber brumale]|nr:transcription factor TFIID complex subunit 8 C-term-domain-containing protein [Tuber brumale]